MQDRVGVVRLKRLLRLSLAASVAPHDAVTAKGAAVMDRFLRAALAIASGTGDRVGRSEVTKFCRDAMVRRRNDDVNDGLDIIEATRSTLLYNTGGETPIPPNAEKLRERCVSPRDRERAGRAFCLALDSVMTAPPSSSASLDELRSRFFADIVTIPLLSWKISALSVSGMIVPGSGIASPRLMDLLRAFVECNGEALSAGKIESLLRSEDVTLTVCPAPPALCLLANLVQLGHICSAINGSDNSKLIFEGKLNLISFFPLALKISHQNELNDCTSLFSPSLCFAPSTTCARPAPHFYPPGGKPRFCRCGAVF